MLRWRETQGKTQSSDVRLGRLPEVKAGGVDVLMGKGRLPRR